MEKGKVIQHTFTGVFCLGGLMVFLGFMGGQWSDTFDGWGQGLRQALGRPISLKMTRTPMSPKGDWQLQIGARQWTWRNTERTTQYDVQALHNGQPILSGANLDLVRTAHRFVNWPAEWQTDTAVSFIEDQAADKRPMVALTVENATGSPIPCLMIYDSAQAHYVFDLAAGAPQALKCPLPAEGEPLTVILGPQGKTLKMKSPGGAPKKLKITLKENQPEEAVMESGN